MQPEYFKGNRLEVSGPQFHLTYGDGKIIAGVASGAAAVGGVGCAGGGWIDGGDLAEIKMYAYV